MNYKTGTHYRTTLFGAGGVFIAVYIAVAIYEGTFADQHLTGGDFVSVAVVAGFISSILFSLFAGMRLSREPCVAALLFGISALLGAPFTLLVVILYGGNSPSLVMFPLITGAQTIAAFVLFWKNQPQQVQEAA